MLIQYTSEVDKPRRDDYADSLIYDGLEHKYSKENLAGEQRAVNLQSMVRSMPFPMFDDVTEATTTIVLDRRQQDEQGKTIDDGLIYGDLYDGSRMTLHDNKERYIGLLQSGKRNGIGIYNYFDGTIYRGDWFDGVKHGIGHYSWPDGGYYHGDFFEGLRHGKGVQNFANGDIYDGNWIDGEPHSEGTYTYPSGAIYRGEWAAGHI